MINREISVNAALALAFIAGSFYVFQPSRPPAEKSHIEKGRKPAAVMKEPRIALSQVQRELRLAHAQELLGKHYTRSVVRGGEKIRKVNSQIYRVVRERLPKKFRKHYQKIAQTIIDESLRNEFDPVFLLSVITGESSFNPDQRGSLDEIGLMQLRPATAEWIAKKYGLKYSGEKTLLDPVQNVKIGAAYLHYLRERFDSHAQLYLAAYNMGVRNVGQALDKNVWPKDYPIHVMRRYVDFYSALGSGQFDNKL